MTGDFEIEIYKTRWFDRWARKQGLDKDILCNAVEGVRAGLVDADLGNGLIKKRIARTGQGKRVGFRTLIATNKDNRWIFVYGCPKNERSNIDRDEEESLKELAVYLLSLTTQALAKARRAGELVEINCNEKEEVGNS
jgi:hypothetical protein